MAVIAEGQIIDAENYKSSDSFGFKDICMRQLQRVVTNMSQEMRKGFWVYSQPSPHQNQEKIRYIGDSRKELKQSLDVLHDILLPKFDEEMKTASKEIYEEEELEEKPDWKTILSKYRKLFQALCLFLERIGWLESQGIED